MMKDPCPVGSSGRRSPLALVALVMVSLVLPGTSQGADRPLRPGLLHALAVTHGRYVRAVERLEDSLVYPRSAVPGGTWKTVPAGDWTSGFFPGALWLLGEWSGDSVLLGAAGHYTAGLHGQKMNRGTHDVGFMLFSSYGHAVRVRPADSLDRVLLEGAATLASRFHPTVGCIKSWDWSRTWTFPVIIDNMMNLELLLWASRNGGDGRLREIAITHARSTIRNHFRADGGTYHVVDYDTATGAVLGRTTHQGAADHSVWARGQAWAIYGFTTVYRETGEPDMLDAAERAADHFLDGLPDSSGVPFWDFHAPGIPTAARDISATAIAASALVELEALTADSVKAARYHDSLVRMLRTLSEPPYFNEGPAGDAMLRHATGNHPAGTEIDVGLIYADYYAIEAMVRYLAREAP